MTTSAPQKAHMQWLGSQSPVDAAKTMEFGISSMTTSSSRPGPLSSLATVKDEDHIGSSDYGMQRMYLEAPSSTRSSYLNDERSAIQPLTNLGAHNRGSSEPCFPSPIGRHNNVLKAGDLNSKQSDQVSTPLIVDHHGSDLFSSTMRSNSVAASQSFTSFLDSEHLQHDPINTHHRQGGAAVSTTASSSAMHIAINNNKYNENPTVEGIGGISLSPPINRSTISEECANQFISSENILSSSSNNLFEEDYSPSGQFLVESPYRNNQNKDGYLRSRAFSSPGPIEFSRISQGLFSSHPESPTASSWQNEYSSPRNNKSASNSGGAAHHIRSYTMGYFPDNNNEGQKQYSQESFRSSINNDNNGSESNSPKWQNTNSTSFANTTPSGVQQQRLPISTKSDIQIPLSRGLSQSSYSNNNEMNQSSSFGHVLAQASTTSNSSNHRLSAGFDQNISASSTGIGTPRSALYYPEKEVHYGQMDHDRTFPNNDQEQHQDTTMNGIISSSSHLYSETAAAYHNSPNASIHPPAVAHAHMCMPGYGYQRHLHSPSSMDVYSAQQQQMNYQSQQMQPQIVPPYLMQQMMQQPSQQMSSIQQHQPYNMHSGILTPQQLQQQQQMLAMQQKQAQGIQQHGHVQGHQRVFIPGMGTMIMSTTTGPDGESIGHLSFPPGMNTGGVGPSNEAPPAVFMNNMGSSQKQQFRAVNSNNIQGGLNNGGGVYQNMVLQQDMLIPPGISSADSGQHITHHATQQTNVMMTPQSSFHQGMINVQGSQNSSPSISAVTLSTGVITKDVTNATSMTPVAIQTHNSCASPNVSRGGHLQPSKQQQHAVDQIVLPVYSFNNKVAGAAASGGSASTDVLGSPSPNIVYNVKFKRTQRSFILGPRAPREIKVGCFVKVEADRGEDLGVVISRVPAEKYSTTNSTTNSRPGGFRGCSSEPPTAGAGAVSCGAGDLKKVFRLATDEEISLLDDKRLEEEALLKICRLKVKQRGLNMNVVDAEYQFDRHKLIFFFEAEGRVDFRELVRDLFSIYKTRIWMQQLDKGGGSGVNSVGICTGICDDFEEDLMCGGGGGAPLTDQQGFSSCASGPAD